MTISKLRLVTKEEPALRAALYLRFSSDVQNERSIDRQRADLEKIAPRLNLTLDKRLYFEDRGTSATTLFDRPGLTRELLGAAERGLFDVVLVEHTDRLARKQADTFWLAEQFKMNGIKIYTPSGEVDPLRLTFESYQNEQFSIILAGRVKSGQNDAIREGRIPHRLGYGYDDIKGRPGEKAINEVERSVVIRIFRECASLKSARSIASDLTRDGILSPTGKAWTFQTINVMLRNQIYAGVYVRNKVRRVRNFTSGKRDARPASPDDLIKIEVERLRIIDQGLWDAAQRVLQSRSTKSHWKQKERPTVTRHLHPFAGLFRCSECGSKMIFCGSIRNGDRSLVCSTAWWRQTCPHRRSYTLSRLTEHATEKMHKHLTNPEFIKRRAAKCAEALARFEREARGERDEAQKELDKVELRIRKLIRLTEDDESEDVSQDVRDRLKELRVEQRGLKQRIALIDAKIVGAEPHPNAAKALARDVDTLYQMLRSDPNNPKCRMALGNVIDKVLVHPVERGELYDVSLLARRAVYLGDEPVFPEYAEGESIGNHGLARINNVNATVPS
jgi:site-specific DNA recombinase